MGEGSRCKRDDEICSNARGRLMMVIRKEVGVTCDERVLMLLNARENARGLW